MLPWRKQHRPHPAAKSTPNLPSTAPPPEPPLSRVSSAPGQAPGTTDPPARQKKPSPQQKAANGATGKTPTPPLKKLIHKAQSWSPKASPSTSVVRENISGGTVRPRGSPELSRFDSPLKDDDKARLGGVRKDPSALSKAAGAALSGVGVSVGRMSNKKTSQDERADDEPEGPQSKPAGQEGTEPPLPPDSNPTEPGTGPAVEASAEEQASQPQAGSSGWMSWWYRSAPTIPTAPAAPEPPIDQQTPAENPANEIQVQEGVSQGTERPAEAEQPHDEPQAAAASKDDAEPSPDPAEPVPAPPVAAGWYGYLPSMNMLPSVPVPGFLSYAYPTGGDSADKKQPPADGQKSTEEASQPQDASAMGESSSTKADSTKEPAPAKDVKAGSSQNATEDVAAKDAPAAQADKKTDPLPKAGSTWAFWYRDVPADPKGKATEPEPGEIAVMGEGSEAQPTPVAASDVAAPAQDSSNKSDSGTEAKEAPSTGMSMWRRTKRARPLSLDIDALLPSSLDGIRPIARASTSDQGAPAAPAAPVPAPAPAPVAEQATIPTRADSVKKPGAVAEIPAKAKPNLLLPSFASTYHMKENPSILRQITNLVAGSAHAPPNHVFRVKSAPKIRKAIAIGVHGFFPASYLRPMIGQPTGTSLRFANLAAEAIRRWADDHGSPSCEIEKVALEGEGRINERVDNLWKLMLNWVDQIRQADLIIMACHSQGVPVGVMLLQKLIDLGIVTRARIGVCAMAGVSLGPFPDLKSSILTGSAAELWEFGNPQSNNSRRFELSLKRILDYGARITFIGSIDDQLVPMESAVYSPANHPYIYRAVFIDGRVHAPDFIAHLVGFALKIRNLGVSDHGLVRELSVALAGSLYSGEGHSRLYYDAAVYDLAITHALETADTARPAPCTIPRRDPGAASLASPNPYVLPWIMRGLLEEAYVKTELSAETEELLRQFDDWKPTNKALKDVKYRLEAVRSKL